MKNKKNKRLVLKSKWQTMLEVLATLASLLVVATVDSDWSIAYFVFLGIQILVVVVSVKVIQHFGDTTKYQ